MGGNRKSETCTHTLSTLKAQAFPHVSSYWSTQCNEGEKGFWLLVDKHPHVSKADKETFTAETLSPDTYKSGLVYNNDTKNNSKPL